MGYSNVLQSRKPQGLVEPDWQWLNSCVASSMTQPGQYFHSFPATILWRQDDATS